MSSTSRAWAAAASIGAVEALKDQGLYFCRWNQAFRLLQQQAQAQANTNLRSYTKATKLSPPAKMQSEDSLRTVMYLSCWGPNS